MTGSPVFRSAAFRVDSGRHIGLGHVMRCLTLADALAAHGVDILFLCRAHTGHAGALIESRGHRLAIIGPGLDADTVQPTDDDPPHAKWLGADWADDAEAAANALPDGVDLLVVDHYALDARWETRLRSKAGKILVIDDLADRKHDADFLLDQTFGRSAEDYAALTPADCNMLIGAGFALLRPQFARLRPATLDRRMAIDHPREILLSLGGSMAEPTRRVLEIAAPVLAERDCRLTVITGTQPGIDETLQAIMALRHLKGAVHTHVENMARLMSAADLAIGGAGATTWERSCLGLPTLSLVLADNQAFSAKKLEEAGAIYRACTLDSLTPDDVQDLVDLPIRRYRELVRATAAVCDGRGAHRVLGHLFDE